MSIFQWKHDGTLQCSWTRANTEGFLAGNRPRQANQAGCVKYEGLHHGSSTWVWWTRVLWNTRWSSRSPANHSPIFDCPTIKLIVHSQDWLTGSFLLLKLFGETGWSVGGTRLHGQVREIQLRNGQCYRLSFSLFGSGPVVGMVVLYKFPPEFDKRNSTPTPRRRLSLLFVTNRTSKRVCPFRKTSSRVTGFCLSALISVSPRNVFRFATNLTLI